MSAYVLRVSGGDVLLIEKLMKQILKGKYSLDGWRQGIFCLLAVKNTKNGNIVNCNLQTRIHDTLVSLVAS